MLLIMGPVTTIYEEFGIEVVVWLEIIEAFDEVFDEIELFVGGIARVEELEILEMFVIELFEAVVGFDWVPFEILLDKFVLTLLLSDFEMLTDVLVLLEIDIVEVFAGAEEFELFKTLDELDWLDGVETFKLLLFEVVDGVDELELFKDADWFEVNTGWDIVDLMEMLDELVELIGAYLGGILF